MITCICSGFLKISLFCRQICSSHTMYDWSNSFHSINSLNGLCLSIVSYVSCLPLQGSALQLPPNLDHLGSSPAWSPQDPSGQYSFDMAQPGQRTAFRLLLSQLSDYGSRSQYIKSCLASGSFGWYLYGFIVIEPTDVMWFHMISRHFMGFNRIKTNGGFERFNWDMLGYHHYYSIQRESQKYITRWLHTRHSPHMVPAKWRDPILHQGF